MAGKIGSVPIIFMVYWVKQSIDFFQNFCKIESEFSDWCTFRLMSPNRLIDTVSKRERLASQLGSYKRDGTFVPKCDLETSYK